MFEHRIQAILGDITRQHVDAIVNAANTTMLGGGGVDGAIHDAAGPDLLEECRRVGPCQTGEARITGAYRLPARHIIHTVGPVWRGGHHQEQELLANCYRNALKVAIEYDLRTIAFPAISTGAYDFPLDRATQIAVREVRSFVKDQPKIEKVTFVCFYPGVLSAYHRELTAA